MSTLLAPGEARTLVENFEEVVDVHDVVHGPGRVVFKARKNDVLLITVVYTPLL